MKKYFKVLMMFLVCTVILTLTGCNKVLTKSTDEKCFGFANGNIFDYYCYPGNTQGYEAITDVVIPETINGEKVVSISRGKNSNYKDNTEMAFCKKSITSVKFPDSLETIGEGTFEDNYITDVEFGNNLKTIKSEAFKNNNISSLNFPGSLNEIKYSAFSSNKLTELDIPGTVKIIGMSCFEDNELTTVKLHDGVKKIEHQAFSSKTLETVYINDDIEYIEWEAFGYFGYNLEEERETKIYVSEKVKSSFNWLSILTGFDTTMEYIETCDGYNDCEDCSERQIRDCNFNINKYVIVK